MRKFLSIVLVPVLAGGCNVQVGDNGLSFNVGNGRARDEWARTYTLPEGGRLEIVNGNGQIEASAAEGRQVQVRAVREARAGTEEDAAALLRSIEMREAVSADAVRIEAIADTSGRRRFTVSYDLRIPAGLAVTLTTENGGIRLENISGQITAASTNGAITGEGLAGSLSADVVNGGIEVEISSLAGDVRLNSVNGGIEIDLPADVRASLDATCVNGGISVDDDFAMAVDESTRRRVAGTLNGGGVKITAGTVNGGVRITARPAS